MIEPALSGLAAFLNDRLGITESEEAVVRPAAPPETDTGGGAPKAALTLIGSDREISVQTTRRSGQQISVAPAPLRLNLDVLLSVSGGDYAARLGLLGRVMRIIHYMDAGSTGLHDPAGNPVRLQLELQSIDMQTSSQIWTALHARMCPHAVYRLRGVVIRSEAETETLTPIRGLDIDLSQ